MPERTEKLRALIGELESELHHIDESDEESKELLREASREILEALQQQGPDGLEPQTFIDRLKETTEDFEVSHPTLASLVGRVVDALGQMGI